jgi:hypothetical protein
VPGTANYDTATPPAAADPDQAELGVIQKEKGIAEAERNSFQDQMRADMASYDPEAEAGQRPAAFTEPTPQDHFGDLMAQAPIMMALGAIGGKFGNAHGVAMLQSTNAMMSGMIKGNDAAYAKAREDYDAKYQQYKEQSKTWLDVYKAYQTAYKGRIDADQRAIQGANASVGLLERDEASTKANIAQRLKLDQKIEEMNQKIAKWDADRPIAQQRADAQSESAHASTSRARTAQQNADTASSKEADKKTGSSADVDAAVALLDKNIDALKRNPSFMAGGGGQLRQGKEYVAGLFDKNADTTATQFRANNELMKTEITKALKSKGKMGKDEREILERAIDVVDGRFTNGPQAIARLEAARDVIKNQVRTPSKYQATTINGQQYYKDSTTGKVYKGTPPDG